MLKLDPNFKPAFNGIELATKLIEKLNLQHDITTAYLFGSSAEGKNKADSDLDILLVIPENEDPKVYYKTVNTPYFSDVAVDWIIKNQKEFDEKKRNRRSLSNCLFNWKANLSKRRKIKIFYLNLNMPQIY